MSALSFTAAVAPANRRVFASAKKTSAAKKAFRVTAYTEERRYEQSMKVMDRTQEVRSMRELEAAMNLAGDALIIVALESDEECVAGDQAACKEVTASLARIARDCKDVVFVKAEVTHSGPEAREIADKLGVHQFPTYQYYKGGSLLWQHIGAGTGTTTELSEGVLYYGGAGAKGLDVHDWVSDINSKSDFTDFIDSCAAPQVPPGFAGEVNVSCDKQLAIVDVGMNVDAPVGCLDMFPAVLSLARNTAGFTRWARMGLDGGPECAALAKEWGVTKVPSFVMFANGRKVDMYEGSNRELLMSHVMNFQKANGITLPQRVPPKRMTNAEAREIAREARERAKAEGKRTGW